MATADFSGRYTSQQGDDLRLDVDGWYPQLTASGTVHLASGAPSQWVAALTADGPHRWTGTIWYRTDDVFGHTTVVIAADPQAPPSARRVDVTFNGGGHPLTHTYFRRDARYRPINLEFDRTPDAEVVTAINTCDHPNRPPSVECEDVSIRDVFGRAGFAVDTSPESDVVPLGGAGTDVRWSDSEMHDAMQTYWSRFSNAPQWALWTFWAALHERGTSLGGVMFDDIGPNHRQGTALFTDSFIKNPPTADPAPAAWSRRMLFWTAVHEMGHAFNLAHSWQKALGTPWTSIDNHPEARSFMNYPYRVRGGERAFFADFELRFSDPELVFLRHAPTEFVQMGNADWFDRHGFASDGGPPPSEHPSLELTVRANREQPVFEFLEPVSLEVKLSNRSDDVVTVASEALDLHELFVIIKRPGSPARRWLPFARYCRRGGRFDLEPGRSYYGSLPIFAGRNGWDICEPGEYHVSVAVQIDDAIVATEPMWLRVQPPRDAEEERLAPAFFTDDVGRTLAFGGTEYFNVANDTLRETVHRLPGRRAAKHAAVALAAPLAGPYKMLVIPHARSTVMSAAEAGGSITERPARVDEAAPVLRATLADTAAAETFGHIGYRHTVESAASVLARQGAIEPAVELQQSLYDVLARRGVSPAVLDEVAERTTSIVES